MKTKNLLINLGLVFSLLFVMAFACNEGDGKRDNGGGTTRSSSRPDTDSSNGGITEQEVVDLLDEYYANWAESHDHQSRPKFTVDGAIRIFPQERHAFQIPPTNYLCSPVKINYTVEQEDGGKTTLTHYSDGTYYFYRNGAGEWDWNRDNEKSKTE